MRVLITGGGCEEPIDGVRSLCNFSTGMTAAFLCDRMAERGHKVSAVLAERAVKPTMAVDLHTFRTFQDLSNTLNALLIANDHGMIIHAAAVSDFGVDAVEVDGMAYPPATGGKIESGSEVIIRLKRNPKIIDSLREWSKNHCCIVVGFKLTNGTEIQEREVAVNELLYRANLDFVVSNDLSEMKSINNSDQHCFRIYGQPTQDALELIATGTSKKELAEFFIRIAEETQGESR